MGFMFTEKCGALLAWMDRVGWAKLERLVVVLLTCLVILWGMRLVSRAARRAMARGLEGFPTEAERRAKTLGSVLENTARILVVTFFVLMTLQEFSVNIGPLVAGAGFAGVALGFGAQSLVKDVIAGFFFLLENQFGVGDIVSADDKHTGTVERMTLRMTQLRDVEGHAHYLPNGSIGQVVVLSKDFAQALVEVEVRVDEDMERVMEVLRDLGAALAADRPEWVLAPTVVKGIERFNATGCTLRTLTRSAPGCQWDVAREFRRRVLLRFRQEGIRLPLPPVALGPPSRS